MAQHLTLCSQSTSPCQANREVVFISKLNKHRIISPHQSTELRGRQSSQCSKCPGTYLYRTQVLGAQLSLLQRKTNFKVHPFKITATRVLEPGWIALEAGVGVVTAASEAATLLTLPLLLTMPSAQVCSPERSNTTTASSALLTYFSLKL
jgi:hypothetical protein